MIDNINKQNISIIQALLVMNCQINDYLDFMTIKNGRFISQKSNVNVKNAICEISDHYMRLATLRGIKFTYKVD
jgi:hypothetical protein